MTHCRLRQFGCTALLIGAILTSSAAAFRGDPPADFDAQLARMLEAFREVEANESLDRDAMIHALSEVREKGLSAVDFSALSVDQIRRLTRYNFFGARRGERDYAAQAIKALRPHAEAPTVDGASTALLMAKIATRSISDGTEVDAPTEALVALGHPSIATLLADERGDDIFLVATTALRAPARDGGPPPAVASITALLDALPDNFDATNLSDSDELHDALFAHAHPDAHALAEPLRQRLLAAGRARLDATPAESRWWVELRLAFLEHAPERVRVLDGPPIDFPLEWWSDKSSGSVTRLSDLRGEIVVLDFWESDCGFCTIAQEARAEFARERRELPIRFVALAPRSTSFVLSREPLEVLSTPTLDDEIAANRRYVAMHGFATTFALATWSDFKPQLGVRALPTTAIIDHRGVVRALEHDPRIPEPTAAVLTTLLAELERDRAAAVATARPATPITQAPPITQATPITQAAPVNPDAPWTLPPQWKVSDKRPPMRFATFIIDDADGPVEVAVTQFPGEVGGVLANINRWRGGIGLEPVTESELPDLIERFENPGFAGYAMHGRGEQTDMLVAGIHEAARNRTWFVRVMASAPIADRLRPQVWEFARSFGRSTPAQ